MIKNTLNEGIPRSKSLDRYPTDRLRTLLRQLTFRSQFFHVCFNTNRAFKMIFGDLRSKPLARYPTGRLRTQRPARTIICFCMVSCWQATYSETSENNRIILYGQDACEDQHRCKPVAPPLDVLKKSMVISTYVLKRK